MTELANVLAWKAREVKTHARSERALSAKLYIDNAFNFVADGELKPVRLMFQRQPYIRMGSK